MSLAGSNIMSGLSIGSVCNGIDWREMEILPMVERRELLRCKSLIAVSSDKTRELKFYYAKCRFRMLGIDGLAGTDFTSSFFFS